MNSANNKTQTDKNDTTMAAALTAAGIVPGKNAPNPSKKVGARRIVAPSSTQNVTPSSAKDLAKAMKSLQSAPATPASTIVEAPKTRKTYEGVTITISKETVIQKDAEHPEGRAIEMLVLSKRHINSDGQVKSHYNYSFDKGYCYYATKGAENPKPSWKWDSRREVRLVPVNDIETLLKGLREYYPGAKLIIGGTTRTTLVL